MLSLRHCVGCSFPCDPVVQVLWASMTGDADLSVDMSQSELGRKRFYEFAIVLPECCVVEDFPRTVSGGLIVDVGMVIRPVVLNWYCYESAFAVELHDEDVEIVLVGDFHELIQPCFQLLTVALDGLMERKISIALTLTVEFSPGFRWGDIPFHGAYLCFSQHTLAKGVFTTDVSARMWNTYECLTIYGREIIGYISLPTFTFILASAS